MSNIKGYRITKDGKVIKNQPQKSVSRKIAERTSKKKTVIAPGKAALIAAVRK